MTSARPWASASVRELPDARPLESRRHGTLAPGRNQTASSGTHTVPPVARSQPSTQSRTRSSSTARVRPGSWPRRPVRVGTGGRWATAISKASIWAPTRAWAGSSDLPANVEIVSPGETALKQGMPSRSSPVRSATRVTPDTEGARRSVVSVTPGGTVRTEVHPGSLGARAKASTAHGRTRCRCRGTSAAGRGDPRGAAVARRRSRSRASAALTSVASWRRNSSSARGVVGCQGRRQCPHDPVVGAVGEVQGGGDPRGLRRGHPVEEARRDCLLEPDPHGDERVGERLPAGRVVRDGDLVVTLGEAGRVLPVDLPDADHAEGSEFDRPQRAHAGGAVDVVAGAQGIEDLVGTHGHGVQERPVDDADDPRRAPGRDEPGQVAPRDGRVVLRVAQPARRVEGE